MTYTRRDILKSAGLALAGASSCAHSKKVFGFDTEAEDLAKKLDREGVCYGIGNAMSGEGVLADPEDAEKDALGRALADYERKLDGDEKCQVKGLLNKGKELYRSGVSLADELWTGNEDLVSAYNHNDLEGIVYSRSDREDKREKLGLKPKWD